jgi:hypothetical protein
MFGVQESELFQHQEQEDHNRAFGNEEILPALPEAPTAQGDQVGRTRRDTPNRAWG